MLIFINALNVFTLLATLWWLYAAALVSSEPSTKSKETGGCMILIAIPVLIINLSWITSQLFIYFSN